MRQYVFAFLTIASLAFTGCLPAEENAQIQSDFRYSDAVVQVTQQHIEQRDLENLYQDLRSKNPNVRFIALRGLASQPNGVSIDSLTTVLSDPVERVRHMAVFALGQTRDEAAVKPLISAFQRDSLDFEVKKYALEAVGKTGSEELLKYIAGVTTYQPTDTSLILGQARSIYQFALRRKTDSSGHAIMNRILTDDEFSQDARQTAAAYFGRLRNVKLDQFAPTFTTALKDADPNVRMFAALALRNVDRSELSNSILSALRAEQDARVQVNLIRALDKSDYNIVKPTLLDILTDAPLSVQNSIAGYCKNYGRGADVNTYSKYARSDLPTEVRAQFYAAALKHTGRRLTKYKDRFVDSIRVELRKTTDPYSTAAFITALGEYPSQYPRLARYMSQGEHPVIRSAAMQALSNIRSMPNLKRLEGEEYERTLRKFDGIARSAFKGTDPAVMAIAADLLRNPKLDFKDRLRSTSFLEDALSQLQIPEQLETKIEIEKTIRFLNGEEEKSTPLIPTRGAEFSILTRYNSNPRATITVENKKIEIELFMQEAPVSVSNFIQLAESDFFNNKVFHRVVPNFVIQGGCPRGDGYGSLDYTIPTEISMLNYDQAGRLGMASAGTDTECSQFFITHSPTPHLDGRYTIFGQVVSGMDVVNSVSTASVIQNVTIFE